MRREGGSVSWLTASALLIVAGLVGALATLIWLGAVDVPKVVMPARAPQETPHDRDLRDCRDRYAYATRYSESRDQADSAALVAACMRGRGY